MSATIFINTIRKSAVFLPASLANMVPISVFSFLSGSIAFDSTKRTLKEWFDRMASRFLLAIST